MDFRCQCGYRFSVTAEVSGGEVRCPHCGAAVETAAAEGPVSPVAAPVVVASPMDPRAVPITVVGPARSGKAGVVAFVAGLLALLLACAHWPAALVLAAVAIVSAIVGLAKGRLRKGLAVAGMVVAIVVLVVIMPALWFYSSFSGEVAEEQWWWSGEESEAEVDPLVSGRRLTEDELRGALKWSFDYPADTAMAKQKVAEARESYRQRLGIGDPTCLYRAVRTFQESRAYFGGEFPDFKDEQHFRRAEKELGDILWVLYRDGIAAQKQGMNDEAVEAYAKVRARLPSDSPLWNHVQKRIEALN